MCEVNDRGCDGEAYVQEDDALEKIFFECDVPSTGRVSVTKLIGYMRDHMSPHGSPEILKDLRKLMRTAASYDGKVTREQYYDVSRLWLAKVRKCQHYQENHQDGNNNLHVDRNSDSFTDDPTAYGRPGSTSRIRTRLLSTEAVEDTRVDTTAGSPTETDATTHQGFLDLSTSTAVNDTAERCETPDPFFGDLSSVDGTYHVAHEHAIVETAQDLRQRAQRCAYDNDLLREELQRAEDSIAAREKELALVTRKLELANKRYERLHGEHEEQRELVAAAERDREALGARNHRLERDNSLLRKEIDAAETEIRRLNADLDKANEQKEERIRLLARCRQELIERKTLYDEARGQILQMELANDQLREKHGISTSTAEHLKVVVKELEARISELQPNQNYILHGKVLIASPPSDNGLDQEMEIFQQSAKMIPCSLRDEMKATGYGDTELDQNVEIRYLNDTIEDQNINSEYVDAIRWATEKLERGTSEFAVLHEKMGIESPPAQSLFQVTGAEEYCPSTEDLQRFGTQIRHALTMLSLTASWKVINADTEDAATQLDLLDLVPEPPAVCNIELGITSYANNNNNNNKFCPTCKRENRTRKEGEEPLVVDEDPGIAPARSPSPLVPPLDVSVTSRSLIACSTPRTSPRQISSRVLSPGYFYERAIIDPVVAALDDIIQGTSGSSSECDATYSTMSSRREHNPRYIYTLPPSRPSESEGDVLCGAESSLSTMPIESSNALSQLLGTMMTDRPEPGSVSGSGPRHGGKIRPQSHAWRCRDTTITDDTSDDTYDTGSSGGQSLSLEERNCCLSTVDLSGSIGMSAQSAEDGDFIRVGRNLTASTETHLVELDPAPVHDETFTQCRTNEQYAPDVVEGLELDLEKLTLRAGMSDDKDRVMHSNSQWQVKIINVNDQHAVEIMPVADHQPHVTHDTHGKVPKRKSSVYQRSSDYYSRLEVGPKTAAGHHPTEYDTEPGGLDKYPHEDSAKHHSSGLDVLGIPTRPSIVKPTKSEVSLGNHRTKYVISGTRRNSLLSTSASTPTLTPCLPSTDEMSGDVASERRGDGREIPAISRSVARAMSSEEDSSDSECARDRVDRGENVQVVVLPPPPPLLSPPLPQTEIHPSPVSTSLTPPQQQQASLQQLSTNEISSAYLFGEPLPHIPYRDDTRRITGKCDDDRQRWPKTNQRIRRSLSESDSGPCRGNAAYKSKCGCNCGWNGTRNRIICGQDAADTVEDPKDRQSLGVFPNLPDSRLIELGLAGPSDGFDLCERMCEDELERKYTALSIGLGTDRVTLPRRLALSLRQRDQAERNLGTEVERMQRDIQALAPLCVDRESVERVERVRHQLEMISRCTLRVSCTAELLGATHQERRVSRAALLADRYLQALRARCEKTFADLAETKRILTENNIVIEENPSELIDDVAPRVRYRGLPSTNRTTMSRRRASIATISRPASVNPLQEATKDNARQQRTPVSARMSLRRPSLGYDTQRWDNEKLDRTDSSSSSIGELREIFEQAESRRGSREENNNLIRSQSSNFSVGSCESGDSDVWASTREDTVGFLALSSNEELPTENRLLSRRTPRVLRTMQEHISRLPISWYILFVAIFFFGFYSNRYVSTRSAAPLKWWSIDEIVKRYAHVQRNMPPPT